MFGVATLAILVSSVTIVVLAVNDTVVPEFRPRVDYLVSGSQCPAIVDFDGDGSLDVVVGRQSPNALAFLHNNSEGVLMLSDSLAMDPPPTHPGPFHVIAVELNGDGRQDLAVVSPAGWLAILRSESDGGWWAPQYLPIYGGAVHVAAGDFDGDGLTDLATANYGQYRVNLWHNMGDGMFEFWRDLTGSPHPDVRWLSIRDVDRDGDVDIVFASGSSYINTYFGDGSGNFVRRTQPSRYSNSCVAVEDFDADGNLDAIFGTDNYPAAYVFWGLGDGTYQEPPQEVIAASAIGVATGDLNGDGTPDVVFGGRIGDLYVFTNNGDRTFTVSTLPMPGYGGARHIQVGDLDGNGWSDVVAACWQEGVLCVFMNARGAVTAVMQDVRASINGDAIDVLWRRPADIEAPVIAERMTEPGGRWMPVGSPVSVRSRECRLRDADIEPGGEYAYRAFDARGESLGSTRVAVPASVTDPRLSVTPNPVSRFATVRAPFLHGTISLYDLSGRQVSRQPFESRAGGQMVDVSRLSEGLYFVEVRDEQRALRRRISVVR